MGDPHRKQQVRNARKRKEITLRDISQPRLPGVPVIGSIRYTLTPKAESGYVPGEKLIVMADENSLRVVRAHECIGSVDGDGAAALREMLCASNCVAEVQVTDVSELSGIAHAEVLQN